MKLFPVKQPSTGENKYIFVHLSASTIILLSTIRGEWNSRLESCPTQEDGHSCGIYVVANMLLLDEQLPLCYGTRHRRFLRLLIAKYILQGSIVNLVSDIKKGGERKRRRSQQAQGALVYDTDDLELEDDGDEEGDADCGEPTSSSSSSSPALSALSSSFASDQGLTISSTSFVPCKDLSARIKEALTTAFENANSANELRKGETINHLQK
jgi:hypothetical protein